MLHWSRSRVRSWSVVIVALAAVLAGCGGGDDDAGGTDEPSVTQAPSAPGATDAPINQGGGGGGVADAVEPQVFDVGEFFFHSGFRVEVVGGELWFEENEFSGAVTNFLKITMLQENLSAETDSFRPQPTITTPTNSYGTTQGRDVPDVPSGLASQATYTYRIDPDFDLATAEIVIGTADVSRAIVPLSGGGETVRLEPTELAVSGTLSMELLDLVFTGGEVRYDIVPIRTQVEAGKQALTLYFDVVSRKGGNWQIFAADLALIGPDGSALGADAIEIGALAGSDEGITTTDRSVRFIVDEMPSGDFVLRLTPGSWFIGDDGVTEATFEFSIP